MPADPASPIVPDPDDVPPRRRQRRGTLAVGVVAVVAVVAGLWYWHVRTPATDVTAAAGPGAGSGAPGARGPGGPGGGRRGGDPRTVLPVAVAPVRSADFVVWTNALGNVTASSTVTVRPRVDGQLQKVHFKEGELVKPGALLAEIDPRPYQVLLGQANGQLARDQAQLANARIDLERYQTLLKQDSIAQQQVDTQAALVRQFEGTIEADRGAVDNAKLQLSFTKITAPAGGRLGLNQVDAGNMVHQSDTGGIVVITQVQPISVLFSIPEDRLALVLRRMQSGEALTVDAYDRDGRVRLGSGKLVSIDNQIDPTTGTIKLKAEFANEAQSLFPNQFVNVRLQLDTLRRATVVQSSAIQRGSPGTFVYRVNDDDTVTLKVVKLGPVEGETTVIESGIEPGERVVIDGADKIKDGAKIEPVSPEQRAAPPAASARTNGGKGAGKGSARRAADGTTGATGAGAPAPAAPAEAATPGPAGTPAGATPARSAPPTGSTSPIGSAPPKGSSPPPGSAPSAASAVAGTSR